MEALLAFPFQLKSAALITVPSGPALVNVYCSTLMPADNSNSISLHADYCNYSATASATHLNALCLHSKPTHFYSMENTSSNKFNVGPSLVLQVYLRRFCQGLQRFSNGQSSRERSERKQLCKHALEHINNAKAKGSYHSEGGIQFWECLNLIHSQNTFGKTRNVCPLSWNSLPRLVPSSHGKTVDKLLRSFLWGIRCTYSEGCRHSIILSIFLSLLMCFSPSCLNGAPAFAHENPHAEALSNNIIDDFKMDEASPETEVGSGTRVHEYTFVTRAAPLFTVSDRMSVCEETYGLFPCSNSLPGNLFLMLVYGYLLLMAAKLISEGSELLLEVMNPGLIGGLVLPILGALPDASLICASGIGGTVEEAQQEVLVGVGVLAGSTTLILSVAWAGSLVVGLCDLSGPGHTAKDLTLTRGFDLFRTGITTDEQTRWGALIMIASGLPYLCAQLPLLDKHPEQGAESALAGCILALSGLVLYCSYQIASPWLQEKKIEEARLQLLRTSALQGISAFSSNLMAPSSVAYQEQTVAPSDRLLQEIFTSFDKNADGKIEQDELRGLILGLNIGKGSFQDKEQVEKWLNEFDVNTDGMLSEAEFLLGVKKWANRVVEQRKSFKFQLIKDSISRSAPSFWGAKLEEAKEALNLLEAEIEQDEETPSNREGESSLIDASKIYQKSVLYLVSGAALAAIFSDPLIDSIQGFSNASRIPPFFVAFIVVPFASNASELFSSIVFAKKKRKRNISLTYSQIYGSVTMNNTLCLGIFLGIVYTRGLTWDFSSEVTVVLLNILCVGLIGISRVTFPLWYAVPVFSLYFLSLGGVALLDNLLGWH